MASPTRTKSSRRAAASAKKKIVPHVAARAGLCLRRCVGSLALGVTAMFPTITLNVAAGKLSCVGDPLRETSSGGVCPRSEGDRLAAADFTSASGVRDGGFDGLITLAGSRADGSDVVVSVTDCSGVVFAASDSARARFRPPPRASPELVSSLAFSFPFAVAFGGDRDAFFAFAVVLAPVALREVPPPPSPPPALL